MTAFDTAMIWCRRTAVPGQSPVYTDSEIFGRIIGERRRRTADRDAEIREELEVVFAPPSQPRPGDLIRRDTTEYRVIESIPRPDLDGILRGCSCTLVRSETEFDTAVTWRRRSAAPGETPVYQESSASCRIVGRNTVADGSEKREEVEIVVAPSASPRAGDLITLAGEDYRVTKARPHTDVDGSLLGSSCTLVRSETEFDTAVTWRRRSAAPGETPVYQESSASCRIVKQLRRRAVGDYTDDFDEMELFFEPPAEPQPGDLISLQDREYRVTLSSRSVDSDGNLLGCSCSVVR